MVFIIDNSVKSRLAAHDVAADRIVTFGYGSANPAASNETTEGRTKNRRIEIRIVE